MPNLHKLRIHTGAESRDYNGPQLLVDILQHVHHMELEIHVLSIRRHLFLLVLYKYIRLPATAGVEAEYWRSNTEQS